MLVACLLLVVCVVASPVAGSYGTRPNQQHATRCPTVTRPINSLVLQYSTATDNLRSTVPVTHTQYVTTTVVLREPVTLTVTSTRAVGGGVSYAAKQTLANVHYSVTQHGVVSTDLVVVTQHNSYTDVHVGHVQKTVTLTELRTSTVTLTKFMTYARVATSTVYVWKTKTRVLNSQVIKTKLDTTEFVITDQVSVRTTTTRDVKTTIPARTITVTATNCARQTLFTAGATQQTGGQFSQQGQEFQQTGGQFSQQGPEFQQTGQFSQQGPVSGQETVFSQQSGGFQTQAAVGSNGARFPQQHSTDKRGNYNRYSS